jgi:hypothetical protein
MRWRSGVAALAFAAAACGEGASPTSETAATGRPRTYALGFTDFPHAFTIEGVTHALQVVAAEGDLAVMHFDDGVPWEEARTGSPYPDAYQADLERKARALPRGHVVYLAVTPIAFERDGLAPRRGDGGSEPLRRPWSSRAFDDPEVVEAYVAHCERMLAIFRPHYFAYAVEANMLATLAPRHWPSFLSLVRQVYPRIKAAHPTLPVFVTVQADFFHAARGAQDLSLAQLLPYTDLLAVSTYPFTVEADPLRLRADHFSALTALAPGKPFAVAETAWPAEDVTAPHPVAIPGSEERQRAYVEWLLEEADRLSAVFVNWFFTRDYDELWQTHLRGLPHAPLLRLWKDTGLYAGDGRRRSALGTWRAARERPRRP